MRRFLASLTLLLLAMCHLQAVAAEANVAVAANFSAPMKRIAQLFEADTGHALKLSFGSTGQFYTQIVNGAPFDMLLAADDETPALLEKNGHAVDRSRFTYATGRLALWSRTPDLVDGRNDVLVSGAFDKIAIANPRLSPYGAAAQAVLQKLKLTDKLSGKVLEAGNITQAFQFVASGNAQIGFVALSQIRENGRLREGSMWLVPEHMHDALRQDAVLLVRGKNNDAAQQLLAYLKTEKAREVMRAFAYTH